jgi:hypothetical protein
MSAPVESRRTRDSPDHIECPRDRQMTGSGASRVACAHRAGPCGLLRIASQSGSAQGTQPEGSREVSLDPGAAYAPASATCGVRRARRTIHSATRQLMQNPTKVTAAASNSLGLP